MFEIDLFYIGKRIQNRRKQQGLTQEVLADKMNVSIQMISNLERGIKSIRIENLVHLSEILGVSTDYILTGRETEKDLNLLSSRIERLSPSNKQMIEMLVDYLLLENEKNLPQ